MLDRRLESNGHGAGDADGSVPPIASSFETFWSVTSRPVGVRIPSHGPGEAPRADRVDRMSKNQVLDLPLSSVMRPEIALPLQHVLNLYTVGSLLKAWRSPKNHRSIEQVFDTPEQARHAVAVCAAWLGVQTRPSHELVPAWWQGDDRAAVGA